MNVAQRLFIPSVLLTAWAALACVGPINAAQPDKSPVKVFILAGQSNMEGHGRISGEQEGTLETLSKNPASAARYRHLLDEKGNWITRDDVFLYYYSPRGKLAIGNSAAKNAIGPELAFGWVVGDSIEAPVLLVKWGPGGCSLAGPWRPPSSGNAADTPRGEKGVGSQYDRMIAGTREALADLDTNLPELAGRNYEITGFGWHQGWNDGCSARDVAEYEKNMANFIKDVRKDLGVPKLPFVIGGSGFGGWEQKIDRRLGIMKAQAAMETYPGFKDNVKYVETRGFFRDGPISPRPIRYHWCCNAESYYLIGEGMGKAMIELLDGDDLSKALKEGDFARYSEVISAWLNRTVPHKISETSVSALLNDPGFRNKLAQRQFITKLGVEHVSSFAEGGAQNREFLSWLLQDSQALEHYLLGATPIGLAARTENSYRLNPTALAIWKNIFTADQDSRKGLHLKLAIATALAPPGSVTIGAGGAATPPDPVARYRYYKRAHQNQELFPRFDNLTVWEYSTIVCSGASHADLTWARAMLNTFRPDLRINERVIHSTSLVWRRNAPAKFYPAGYQNFKNVLAGGGKCGPRASWAQMVCHAFGIPVVGVRQPAHACAAYKAANPMIEPQPGSIWKVVYGRGWHVSKAKGLAGPDFLAGVHDRSDFARFSTMERLRWLASALTSDEKAVAVTRIAHKIQSSPPNAEPNPIAVPTSVETDVTPATSAEPTRMIDGAIQVEAASFVKTGGEISWDGQFPHVLVHDSFTGGTQVYFQSQMRSQWADYLVDVPASGIYAITLKAAVINDDQELEVCCGGRVLATVPIPLSFGTWQETPPVQLKLEKGVHTLRIQTPTTEHKRGIALKSFKLKSRRQG